jgi:MerR family transcriptional regulator, copper efflux regulator
VKGLQFKNIPIPKDNALRLRLACPAVFYFYASWNRLYLSFTMLIQDQNLLLIGQVAKASGLPIKTIRYYAEMGLLKTSGRSEGQFRLFSADVIDRLAFIKRIQKLGLSLQEIAGILQIYDRGLPPCSEIKQQLEHQISEIDRRIQELVSLRREISGLIEDWNPAETIQTGEICPVIQRESR